MFCKVPFAEVNFLFESASIRVRGHINHGHVMGSDEIFSNNIQIQVFAWVVTWTRAAVAAITLGVAVNLSGKGARRLKGGGFKIVFEGRGKTGATVLQWG
jgi:hypothetical protein